MFNECSVINYKTLYAIPAGYRQPFLIIVIFGGKDNT